MQLYTQTRIALPKKAELYQPKTVNGFSYKKAIPKEYSREYQKAICVHGTYYFRFVQEFHRRNPNPPYSFIDFLDFLQDTIGLTATVKPFEYTPEISTFGTWEWDDKERTSFSIFVSPNLHHYKLKTTIIHEAIHPIQDFDYYFQDILESYSYPLRVYLADRIAEKTMVEVLLPTYQVEQDVKTLNVLQIANKYNVSAEMASYCYN